MKDWKNSERFIAEKKECKRCLTSRGIKKIKDAVSRTRRKLRSLWYGRSEENE